MSQPSPESPRGWAGLPGPDDPTIIPGATVSLQKDDPTIDSGPRLPVPSPPSFVPPVTAVPTTSAYPVYPQWNTAVAPMGAVLMQLGDITVTEHQVITPHIQFPLMASSWEVTDQWFQEQKTPTWAITLAILLTVVGFCFLTVFSLLFLLFLLAKETRYTGVVQVRVSNGPAHHVTRIPVQSHSQVVYTHNQVNYLRALALQVR